MSIVIMAGLALAGPIFGEAEAEVMLGRGGTWSRLHPVEAGFWFFQVSGGDVWGSRVDDDLGGYDDHARTQLTDSAVLQDAQVERCHDGGWLVVGSYSVGEPDDSGAAWRLDAEFGSVEAIAIEERVSDRAHHDPVALCAEGATGAMFANRGGAGATFFPLDDGGAGEPRNVDFQASGGSLAIRAEDGRVVGADVKGVDAPELRLTVFDEEWGVGDRTSVSIAEGRASWPQRLLPLGEGWVVAYLTDTEGQGGGDGGVWLAALDADFTLVDSVRLSEDAAKDGRPWVVRKGGTLAVSYDRGVQPYARLVHIQPDAVPADDGLLDTGATGNPAADCGCGTSGGGIGWGVLGLVGAGVSRRAGAWAAPAAASGGRRVRGARRAGAFPADPPSHPPDPDAQPAERQR